MEFAMGAMSSLLPKLGELLLEEYNLKDSVKKGIGDLKAELESMQRALEKVSSVPLDQLDPQVKIWANEVRELSYAIEDSLDSFVMRVKGGEPTKTTIKNLLKKAHNKCTKIKARHEIASDIKEIESQVMKIRKRYDRYKIDDIVANPASTTVDPRLSALYKKASDLVGTDGPIDELRKVLFEGVGTSQENPKVVSIVGFGGLGKTTLAKALYDNISNTYQCKGFVPVGQNQDTKKVLKDILHELDIELYKAASTMEVWQLINHVKEILAGKRWILHGTDSDGEDITTHQQGIRWVIKTLEARLRDTAQPRLGRYDEQELRGFVTQFKSLLYDGAGPDQEEETDSSAATECDNYTDDGDIQSKKSEVHSTHMLHGWYPMMFPQAVAVMMKGLRANLESQNFSSSIPSSWSTNLSTQ